MLIKSLNEALKVFSYIGWCSEASSVSDLSFESI